MKPIDEAFFFIICPFTIHGKDRFVKENDYKTIFLNAIWRLVGFLMFS